MAYGRQNVNVIQCRYPYGGTRSNPIPYIPTHKFFKIFNLGIGECYEEQKETKRRRKYSQAKERETEHDHNHWQNDGRKTSAAICVGMDTQGATG